MAVWLALAGQATSAEAQSLRLPGAESASPVWAHRGERTAAVGRLEAPSLRPSEMGRTERGLVWGGIVGAVFGGGTYTLWTSNSEDDWGTARFLEASLLGACLGASIGAILTSL